MKTCVLLKTVLLASTGALLLTGCVYHERVVYRAPYPPVATSEVVVTAAPPPPIVETRVVAPGPGFVWVSGCWDWRGRWMWVGGHWARPPRHVMVWAAPRYEVHGGHHVYVRGGWRQG